MPSSRLIFRLHAIQRMFERRISAEEVHEVIARGKEIESYPADSPYPSRLVLGWSGVRPVHIVVAENTKQNETIVITVYEPDPSQWEPGFERRRKK